LNWGIIGYGEITPAFIQGLTVVNEQRLYAIATVSKHDELKRDNLYPGTKIYSTYSALFDDPLVDIVYICTTNNIHKENALEAIAKGKHILCEKPLALNAHDVIEITVKAKEANVFLMEGMWTRFLPAYRHLKEVIQSGILGKVNFMHVDFGFKSIWNKERRLLNKSLGGGSVLDNMDYNIFLCQDLFNEMPLRISANASYAETGVDTMCGIMMQYPTGSIAQLFSSFVQATKQEALIYGENGYIRFAEFWHGTDIEVSINKITQISSFPLTMTGFEFEIEEVVNSIKNNDIENKLITHQNSIDVAKIMDTVLKQIAIETSIIN